MDFSDSIFTGLTYVSSCIIVMSKNVSKEFHFLFIGFRFENVESSQTLACLVSEPHKYTVADQKKIIAQQLAREEKNMKTLLSLL